MRRSSPRGKAKAEATGKKPGGKPPAPPVEGPLPTDQINLTDEESRIMPVAGGGFEQCYNAQAVVAAGSLLVVATDVVQAANDKQQLEPMLEKHQGSCPRNWARPKTLLADNGYFSAANVAACEAGGDRAADRPGPAGASSATWPSASHAAPPHREHPTPVEAMAHRLKTTPRARSSTRCASRPRSRCSASSSRCWASASSCCAGWTSVRGEWSLVTMAWNMKRMFALVPA